MKLNEKPLDLDKLLGKSGLRNQVYLVGIELEGGWTKLPDGTHPVHDGSVSVEFPKDREFERRYNEWSKLALKAAEEGRPFRVQPPTRTAETGEIPSNPMELDKIEPWMKKFYPQIVNDTCGLHVHMSFKSALQYQRLMTPTYPATIIEYFTSWAKSEGLKDSHPIWERLSGKNRYCKHEFHAQQQVTSKKDHNQTRPGHRYTIVNYCYSVHGGTLECRLLPMFETAAQGIRAVEHVLAITNAFLM